MRSTGSRVRVAFAPDLLRRAGRRRLAPASRLPALSPLHHSLPCFKLAHCQHINRVSTLSIPGTPYELARAAADPTPPHLRPALAASSSSHTRLETDLRHASPHRHARSSRRGADRRPVRLSLSLPASSPSRPTRVQLPFALLSSVVHLPLLSGSQGARRAWRHPPGTSSCRGMSRPRVGEVAGSPSPPLSWAGGGSPRSVRRLSGIARPLQHLLPLSCTVQRRGRGPAAGCGEALPPPADRHDHNSPHGHDSTKLTLALDPAGRSSPPTASSART